MATFDGVRQQVESLSGRRFTRGHLAQMKHIYPDGFRLEPLKTSRGENLRDIRIELLTPAPVHHGFQEGSSMGSGKGAQLFPGKEPNGLAGSSGTSPEVSLVLRKRAFRARLSEFARLHPSGIDIRQATLLQETQCAAQPKADRPSSGPLQEGGVPLDSRLEPAKSCAGVWGDSLRDSSKRLLSPAVAPCAGGLPTISLKSHGRIDMAGKRCRSVRWRLDFGACGDGASARLAETQSDEPSQRGLKGSTPPGGTTQEGGSRAL